MTNWENISVAGKNVTSDGEFDASAQGNVLLVNFANQSTNVLVTLMFGGCTIQIFPGGLIGPPMVLPPPYRDRTIYRYFFTDLGAGPFTPNLAIIYVKQTG